MHLEQAYKSEKTAKSEAVRGMVQLLCTRIPLYEIGIRYGTRCYFNVRSKADMSQLNLPHGTDN